MFTGLICATGRLLERRDHDGGASLRFEGPLRVEDVSTGASVSHSGVCLTVTRSDTSGELARWSVDAVPETLQRTGLGHLAVGDMVNLEPSLRLGDELGGHLVFGHVDGLGDIISVIAEGEGYRIRVRPPADLKPMLAEKGSVTVDGVSLTVAKICDDDDFELAIIPHTWSETNLNRLQAGDRVHLEADMLARYVARQLAFRNTG